MSGLQRVFIDTSELFPFTIMDTLLTMSEDLLFTWVWTDEVLDEWEQVIVREGVRSTASARSVTDAVRMYFEHDRIDPAQYRDKVTADLSPDPGDRIHAAACVHGAVDVLLTRNLTHLRTSAIAAAGVDVMTSDAFLCALFQRHPAATRESFVRAATARRNPPTTPRDLADRMAKAGTPRFTELLLPDLP